MLTVVSPLVLSVLALWLSTWSLNCLHQINKDLDVMERALDQMEQDDRT